MEVTHVTPTCPWVCPAQERLLAIVPPVLSTMAAHIPEHAVAEQFVYFFSNTSYNVGARVSLGGSFATATRHSSCIPTCPWWCATPAYLRGWQVELMTAVPNVLAVTKAHLASVTVAEFSLIFLRNMALVDANKVRTSSAGSEPCGWGSGCHPNVL